MSDTDLPKKTFIQCPSGNGFLIEHTANDHFLTITQTHDDGEEAMLILNAHECGQLICELSRMLPIIKANQ